MRVLITGTSSPLATSVLQHLVAEGDVEIWCTRHRNEVSTSSARLRVVDLDLESDESVSSLPTPFDVGLHFAGLTQALDEQKYWNDPGEQSPRLQSGTLYRAELCWLKNRYSASDLQT